MISTPEQLLTYQRIAIGALCAWREARGGGQGGMQSVLNVLRNRANRDHTSIYTEATERLQFSSLTAAGDSQLIAWPSEHDPQMAIALELAEQAEGQELEDLTHGATLYYNPAGIGPSLKTFTKPDGIAVLFPKTWNVAKVKMTAEIAHHLFFTEA